MSGLGRAVIAGLVVGSMLCACGTDASDPDSASDVAGRVEVGEGRHLYLDCRGEGSPTVVLQSGFGNAGDIWELSETDSPAVQPALAETTRVCAYDRPGSLVTTTVDDGKVSDSGRTEPARSDQVPMPRDPAEVVAELHELLDAAGEAGPYLLVGHSMGGPLQALFAATYPDETAGLVLVDAPMPELRDSVTPDQWELIAHPKLAPGTYPEEYIAESYSMDMLLDEVEAAGPLPSVPVAVLVRGREEPMPDPPPENADDYQALAAAWPRAQAAFAASLPDAELTTVPGTTHHIQNQRPDAVVDAVDKVRNRAKG
ncbi:alpha/beta fold hydrolase [Gordonia paraffinivorans]|uniref:alpha/beta fold hydrolase n=1 Tax=Gordonia paraffinivorans TaxID=175628 RepID=UPI001446B26D|nr:alpha/beta hydrolase [Gordonia paraffinivorans]